MPVSTAPSSPFRGYRFPAEIITHAIWLYYRFALSSSASRSVTRPSVSGAASSARCSQASSVDAVHDEATGGFWARWP